MKKNFIYALMSAIALTGVVGFSSCSSDEESAEVNPSYDPATGLVKSQFVLNIASNAKTTRSGATTVQAGGENFRGIDNTLLFAFQTNSQGFVDATFAGADAANRYDLGMVAAAGTLDNDGNKSHRILELAIPTGTDAMLFYGKAIKGSSTPDYNEIGKVTYTISGKKATAFNFALNSRVGTTTGTNTDADRFKYTAELLAAIMTKIVNVSGSYTVNTTTFPDWTGASSLSSTWQDLNPTTQGRALKPLEEILYKAFHTLTSYGTDELRGGSSKAVLTTVRDLYAVTTKVVGATATSPYEELARNIAEAINTQITTYFTTTSTPIDGIKGVSGIKTSMGTSWNANWDVVKDTELADFPVVTFTLPEGCAQLDYSSSTNAFTHITPGTSLLNKLATTDPAVYQFPAELMYYCNSGVRTSNKEKTSSSGYPNGVANWDDNSKWDSDWTGTSVTSATRATAMTKNVNYGVALLETTVGIKTGTTELEDNRAALNPGEENQTFSPSDIDITWTGVIVGGQPASVDWQFLPTSSSFDKLVYDNRVTGVAAGTALPSTAGSASAPNYTILFDNWVTGTTQNKVRVALQFVNNGDDFWGRDNLIRKGQTFYLVAELDPTGKEIAAADWDKYYQVPPLDATGKSTKTTRVFVQDYMTTANFKFTADATNHTSSLQDAYVTIPDLRSSQLSFGLSVDLDWRPGLTFDDVALGGN